ncbi:glycerol-3-phosphate acyltransferase [Permianibacter sp. IMCC34836]|uniref:1-acyl-sn-glycerol-3-phosphate acyltransferase n=1 Tax=Permianibacter fluminis TaxID=2738515 RepID=UPI0015559678|nr:1-acyl-sn-glycerol-3-phosphate acyltransferase [Permianibacter fluminis]NQD36791.1 glycerol-3-phosphate acyltransferase [Permianibacter fluminis]
MTSTVTLPLWLVLLLLVLSLWMLASRLLMPSMRWLMRRRVNKVINRLNQRLHISIRPFQLTKREALIDRLAYDPKVLEAVAEYANEKHLPRELVQQQVHKYAREIVPAFNAYIYYRVGYALARRFARFLYSVRVRFHDDNKLAGIDSHAAVVFVMNHRSNMDYVLVAFLAAKKTALSYAVGEWARIWPLQQLIRAMGAFFVRRNSKDPLYRRVLERYVSMATEQGVCQAVFPEGGLSRDGKLQSPRLGILDYMLRSFGPRAERDIVFVPVGINYDRVLEDRTLLRTLDPSAPKRSSWFALRTTVKFVGQSFWLMLRSRWQRFGYASVVFGSPLSVRSYCAERQLIFAKLNKEERIAAVAELSQQLMTRIDAVVPVLPVPLACATLLEAGGTWLSALTIKAHCQQLLARAAQLHLPIVIPPAVQEAQFDAALHMLEVRHLVEVRDGSYRAVVSERAVLQYYANTLPQALRDGAASGERQTGDVDALATVDTNETNETTTTDTTTSATTTVH